MSEQNIALVTGASRGIGKAIAHQLAADGFLVIGTATSEAGAASIPTDLKEAGFEARGLVLNIADVDSVKAFFDQLKVESCWPSVLVNNAGATKDGLLLRMSEAQWQDVININLNGAYRVTKGCIKHMIKSRQGRIINVSSVVATMGNPGQSNYVAAKAGLLGFTRALAHELGSRNITVNAVAPGFIETDMTAALDEKQQLALSERVALGRLGSAEDIAHAVSFLASPGAGYITGETLHVNGGLYMA